MARSVSRHSHASEVVYLNSPFEDDPDFGWRDFIDDLKMVLKEKYKSLDDADRWESRENHVILDNRRGEVSVAEYNGLVSVSIAPLDPDNALDVNWADGVAGGFRKHLWKSYPSSALVPAGSASNGEAFFSPLNRVGGLVTSKEGELW